jgi:hypothetical protein
MKKFIQKHGAKIQWQEIFINNGYGIENAEHFERCTKMGTYDPEQRLNLLDAEIKEYRDSLSKDFNNVWCYTHAWNDFHSAHGKLWKFILDWWSVSKPYNISIYNEIITVEETMALLRIRIQNNNAKISNPFNFYRAKFLRDYRTVLLKLYNFYVQYLDILVWIYEND